MNRIEDKFKDAFDHFEPEVDPGVWTKISAELPSAPSSVSGGSSAVKGLAAKLGVKGIAAIVAAAAITVSVVYYSATREKSLPSPVSSTSVQEQGEQSEPLQEAVADAAQNTPSSNNSTTVSGTSDSPEVVEEQRNNSGHTEERIVNPNASTGTTTAAGGEAVKSQQTPAQAVSSPVSNTQEPEKTPSPTSSAPVPANNNPSPVLIVSGTNGFAPLTITALTNQQGKNADFDFGDGSTADNRISAVHTYDKAGDYNLQCVVDGITLIKTIHIAGSVPTAFSPNGDGINDQFEIENTDDIQLEIRIFTRSGKQVFSGKGTKISWDGRLQDGRMADPGTYLYDIFATSGDGSSWKQKGSLHLFN